MPKTAGRASAAGLHISLICAELEAMLRGENNRLIINIPPRYMKSIICSVAWPAYVLGHCPQEAVVCVSYADELSKKLAAGGIPRR